jgi:hypothetical protein
LLDRYTKNYPSAKRENETQSDTEGRDEPAVASENSSNEPGIDDELVVAVVVVVDDVVAAVVADATATLVDAL